MNLQMKPRKNPLSERSLNLVKDAGVIGYKKSIEFIREAWAYSLIRDGIREDRAWVIAGGFCPMCAVKVAKYFEEKEDEENLPVSITVERIQE